VSTRLEHIAANWQNPGAEGFSAYVRPLRGDGHKDIDPAKLEMQFLLGDDRSTLKLLSTGNASLLLLYRKRKGLISSIAEVGDDLEILQFQGDKQEGYRVTQGLYLSRLIADQVRTIAYDPDANFSRITMPDPIILTENMSSVASPFSIMRIPQAIEKYQAIISRLGMEYSDEEKKYIVEIKK
jgi:hypothetical protein